MNSPRPDPARRAERESLVDSIVSGPRSRVTDPRVIQAMREVPRHRFVPTGFQGEAYADRPLPIGEGQTISQPSLVAYMTQELHPRPDHRVLEIGTGCGYQAAILSRLVDRVFTIELRADLAQRARHLLGGLGYDNVRVRVGDGRDGWPEEAPFDAILAACAPEEVPGALFAQLREGGRLVIPLGPVSGEQELHLIEKGPFGLEDRVILPVRFVPMTGLPPG